MTHHVLSYLAYLSGTVPSGDVMNGQQAPRKEQPDPGRRYYGKYRGKVLMNLDPLELGRLLVDVPAIDGLEASWALPCVPYAGMQVGFVMLPPIGANVWVEFEGGDPTHPIWAGCFWAELEKPLLALTPFQKVIQTDTFSLLINDMPGIGGMVLQVNPPAVPIPVTVAIDALGLQVLTGDSLLAVTPLAITAAVPPSAVLITPVNVSTATVGAVTVTSGATIVASEAIGIASPATAVASNVAAVGNVAVDGTVTAGLFVGPLG
jgi:hypothetical protein